MPASIGPRQELLEVRKEMLPAKFGALVVLRPIRREARLLHAQMGPGTRWRERQSNDSFQTQGTPCVRQFLVRLDGKDFTIDDAAPVRLRVRSQIETVA